MTDYAPPPRARRFDWQEQALCAQIGTHAAGGWVAERGCPVQKDLAEVCGHCPVRVPCARHFLNLEDARPQDRTHGLWAGISVSYRSTEGRREAIDELRRLAYPQQSARDADADQVGDERRAG